MVYGLSDVFIGIDTHLSDACRTVEEFRMPPEADADSFRELFRACYWADEKAISIGKKWYAK